jgi:hypothetical protein
MPETTVLDLLLLLRCHYLLLLHVDLLKHSARLISRHRAPLAGLKTCDHLLFLLSRNLHSHPIQLHRSQHTINLLSFLNLAAILCLLLNHLIPPSCTHILDALRRRLNRVTRINRPRILDPLLYPSFRGARCQSRREARVPTKIITPILHHPDGIRLFRTTPTRATTSAVKNLERRVDAHIPSAEKFSKI